MSEHPGTVDSTDLTLNAGETQTVTLTWTTTDDDIDDWDATITSADTEDTTSVSVTETPEDSTDLTLNAGETQTVTLTWSDTKPGDWDATVSSADTEDTTGATVNHGVWPRLTSFSGPNAGIYGIIFTGGDRLCLAPGGNDPNLYVYQPLTNTTWPLEGTVSGPSAGFWDIDATDTAGYLAGASRASSGEVWVWDTGPDVGPENWTQTATLTDATGTNFAIGMTDSWVIAANDGAGGDVWAFDSANGTATHQTALSDVPATGRGVGITGSFGAIGAEDGSITIYDTADWTTPLTTLTDPNDSVWSISITENYLAAGTWNDGVYLYSLSGNTGYGDSYGTSYENDDGSGITTELVAHFNSGAIADTVVYGVTLPSTEDYVIATTSANDTVVYYIETAEEARVLSDHTGAVREPAFSDDDAWLATGSLDQTAELYDSPIADAGTYVGIQPDPATTTIETKTPGISTDATVQIQTPPARTTTPVPAASVSSIISASVSVGPPTAGVTTTPLNPVTLSNAVVLSAPVADTRDAAIAPTISTGIAATIAVPTASLETPPPIPSINTEANVTIGPAAAATTVSPVVPDHRVRASSVRHKTAVTGADETASTATGQQYQSSPVLLDGVKANQIAVTGERLGGTLTGTRLSPAQLRGEYIEDEAISDF